MKTILFTVFVLIPILIYAEISRFQQGPRVIPWIVLLGLLVVFATLVFTRVIRGSVPRWFRRFMEWLTRRAVTAKADRIVKAATEGLTHSPRK